MRYPGVCNFPVDLKTLSDGARDELYNLASDLLIAIGIIVNLLFFYIVLTNINVALGIWGGINGYVLALVICSIAGASLYYVTRMMGLR